MNKQFEILRKTRATVLDAIEKLSLEQLSTIPAGFNNNIFWNVAHLVVTQQILCYKLSGQPMSISDELFENYRKGTAPERGKIVTQAELDLVKKLFTDLPIQFEKDYNEGIFTNYTVYETSMDVTLDSIEAAIAYNNMHEGIHLGSILALRKLV